VAGESLYFAYYNGSKRSCSVDLKRKEGLAVFRDLVVRSDVLIDNLRPGALERLGLGEPGSGG
jgi:formyl-CoA transferase